MNIDQEQMHTIARGTFTALSLFSLMLAGAYFEQQEGIQLAAVAATEAPIQTHVAPRELEAKSAILYDVKTGKILFEKNANEPLPLASLTKLISADAILSLAASTEQVAITLEDLAPEGDSGLLVGDLWSIESLLTFGLVASSNDAMAAAAASAGTSSIVNRMNERALELGLTDMQFVNPTGLDIDTETAGAYGSAKDMAIIVAEFLKSYPNLFGTTVSGELVLESQHGGVKANPTAKPLLDIPGLLGAKTGYTDLAGGNLVAAFDLEIGHPVIAVVLGSSVEGRFEDVRELIRAARAAQ